MPRLVVYGREGWGSYLMSALLFALEASQCVGMEVRPAKAFAGCVSWTQQVPSARPGVNIRAAGRPAALLSSSHDP